jgi:hypothetical protein
MNTEPINETWRADAAMHALDLMRADRDQLLAAVESAKRNANTIQCVGGDPLLIRIAERIERICDDALANHPAQ